MNVTVGLAIASASTYTSYTRHMCEAHAYIHRFEAYTGRYSSEEEKRLKNPDYSLDVLDLDQICPSTFF